MKQKSHLGLNTRRKWLPLFSSRTSSKGSTFYFMLLLGGSLPPVVLRRAIILYFSYLFLSRLLKGFKIKKPTFARELLSLPTSPTAASCKCSSSLRIQSPSALGCLSPKGGGCSRARGAPATQSLLQMPFPVPLSLGSPKLRLKVLPGEGHGDRVRLR